jgi:two-component system nitrogen regulation sensor histidine kinase NtrY
MYLSNILNSIYSFIKRNQNSLIYLFTLISLVLGVTAYYIFSHKANINFIISLAVFELVSVLILATVLTIKILEFRKNQVTKGLQSEIIMIFSIITIIPTILISIFSVYFFIFGIQSWFNNKVTSMLDLSLKIGESYIEEHNLHLKNTAISFGKDLSLSYHDTKDNNELLQKIVNTYADLRGLDEVVLFKGTTRTVIAQSRFAYSLTFSSYPSEQILQSENGKPILIPSKKDRIRALIKLDRFDDTYLIIGRIIDDNIVQYIDKSDGVAKEFYNLQNKISSIQVKFILIFILVSLLLLITSINIGILFANKILKPIEVLVNAVKSVKQGDLSTRIKVSSDNNEIALLSKGFNEMVTSIDQYRKDLVFLQKSLAWSDVARRVAHEIKNPLTPMQLAAERLKTKFLSQIHTERDNFERYINTITRHIDDITKIVFDFVNFVRMPKPNYIECNFVELIKELVEAREALHEDIKYTLTTKVEAIAFKCDKNQINQVFVNLFQNAEEALEDVADKEISITIERTNSELHITISDNGPGFSSNILNKALEAYVTTKINGTGLGLAIINSIITDHGGLTELSNNKNGGALICLKFTI